MCARIVFASFWRITSCGCHRDMVTAPPGRRSSAAVGAPHAAAATIGERPTAYWQYNSAPTPLGLCDNLVNVLKLLADQQKVGDSPTESIVPGLHEKRRKGIMDGPGCTAPRRQIDPGEETAVQRGLPRVGCQKRRRRIDLAG